MSTRKKIREAQERARVKSLAASKRAKRVRKSDEFNLASLIPTMRSPIQASAAWSWLLPDIMNARDAQQIGQFLAPVRLAESFRTDDACYTATQNRLAPQRAIGVEMQPGKGTRASQICNEAEAIYGCDGVGLTPETLGDINRTLADHGFAIAVNIWTPRVDGSRVDVEVKNWPLEFVSWHSGARCLVTRIDPYPTIDACAPLPGLPRDYYGNPKLPTNMIPIVPGDGRWIFIAKSECMPWRTDAALLSTALIFAAHALAIRAWSKNSDTHGNAKVVGELPEGFDLDPESPNTKAFLDLLEAIAASDLPFGIKPFGSKVEILANQSRMHEVFAELALNREKAVHRVYCGTDAALGAQGGAPGQDVEALFGVSTTIVQGDLGAIERGLYRHSIVPWTAVNFGDSSQAPSRKRLVPDTDAGIRADQLGKQQAAYIAAVREVAAIPGMKLTQPILEDLAGVYGAKPLTLPEVEPVQAPASAPPQNAPGTPAAPGAPPLAVVR